MRRAVMVASSARRSTIARGGAIRLARSSFRLARASSGVSVSKVRGSWPGVGRLWTLVPAAISIGRLRLLIGSTVKARAVVAETPGASSWPSWRASWRRDSDSVAVRR